MAFPSVLNVFTRPTTTDKLNSPSHSGLHNTVSSALGQVEAMIGVVGASSVAGTLSYDVRSPGSDGGGPVQTANKGGTGQTAYTKGDLLVAQSASVLAKLTVGTNNYTLIADSASPAGIKWNPAPLVNVQSFVSTGMWTRPANAQLIVATLVGAGGGGMAGNGNPGGAGGGGGTIAVQSFDYLTVMQASMLVSVSSVTAAGTKGADSYFGNPSILVAGGGAFGVTGGGGGGSILSAHAIAGGNGGAGGTASFNGPGGSGGGGGAGGSAGTSGGGGSSGVVGTAGVGGAGGITAPSILGYGGNGVVGFLQSTGTGVAGNPGSIYGGGGGGGTGNTSDSGDGGTGAGGYAIITTFTT